MARFFDPVIKLAYRLRGRRSRHLRYYLSGYCATQTPLGYCVVVNGREYRVDRLDALAASKANVEANVEANSISIVAAGPSLANVDLTERWAAHRFLAVNGSHRIYSGEDQVFDYYLVNDIGFIRRQWQSFLRGVALAKTILIDHRVLYEVLQRDANALEGKTIVLFDLGTRPYGKPLVNYLHQPDSGVYTSDYFSDNTNDNTNDKAVFSINPDAGFAPGGTVAYLALQLVVAMGFSRILFLGLDLNDGGRFYTQQNNEKSMLAQDYSSLIEPHFKLARVACDALGVKLYNASQVSRLPQNIIPGCELNTFYDD